MNKQKLFDDDSEEEVQLKTENEYSKKYDQWRGKEEIHKLEQKYGSKVLNSDASVSSDSEDESDEPPEVSEEMETQFLKTLALLKKKDPRIYDPGYKFFDEKEKEQVKETKEAKSLTFADSDEDDDNDDDNIFSIEKKAEVDDEPITEAIETTSSRNNAKKNGKIKEYLTGRVDHIDNTVQKDLEPLKALWSDPTINEGEAFLRDYILNKKYLEAGPPGAGGRLRDDDDLQADEETMELQDKFERAYNFRFEEPDQEYLKRFPRTMSSVRPRDERRAKSRAELRARKDGERTRKMEEIARLKALKLQEIHEKIARIKEVTGNQDLGFTEEDIDGEFDPAAHDRRMRAAFDDRYYGEAAEDREKPVFPDLDNELEIENWDNYEGTRDRSAAPDFSMDGHCEDDDFNMDADHETSETRASLLEEMRRSLGCKRRNRKNKSKLARLLARDKPVYIPDEGDSYLHHMEEYYRMDCEDVIGGDLPTRFKYREVVPNDYGLTIEEILVADDRELTQWVPLKKIVRHQPESVQRSEVNTFAQKAADTRLKRKLLPSLFKNLPEEPELVVSVEENNKRKKKNKKRKQNEEIKEPKQDDNAEENEHSANNYKEQNSEAEALSDSKVGKKKRKRNNDQVTAPVESTDNGSLDVENVSVQVKPHEVVGKKKINSKEKPISNESDVKTNVIEFQKKNKTKKERTLSNSSDVNNVSILNDTIKPIVNTSTEVDQSLTKRQKKNLKKKIKKLEKLKNNPNLKGGKIDSKKRKISQSESQVPNKKQKNGFNNLKKDNSDKEDKKFSKEEDKLKKGGNIPIKGLNGTKTLNKEANTPDKERNKNKSLNKEQRKPDTEGKTNNSFNKGNTPGKEGNKNKDFKNKDKFKKKHKDNNQFKNKIKQIIDKNKNSDKTDNPMSSLSDERLKAYGLNPKKYRGFLKYKKF